MIKSTLLNYKCNKWCMVCSQINVRFLYSPCAYYLSVKIVNKGQNNVTTLRNFRPCMLGENIWTLTWMTLTYKTAAPILMEIGFTCHLLSCLMLFKLLMNHEGEAQDTIFFFCEWNRLPLIFFVGQFWSQKQNVSLFFCFCCFFTV